LASQSKLQIQYWAIAFIVLGLSMMFAGGLYPTTFARQIESSVSLLIVQITAPATITLGIQSYALGTPMSGHTAPEPQTATVTISDASQATMSMIVFGGTTNVLNGQITLMSGSTVLQTYTADSGGYYGYKAAPPSGYSIVVKSDGLYVNGVKKLAATYSGGESIGFRTQIGSTTSGLVTAVTKPFYAQPQGTVTIEGCDHTKWSNVQSDATIKTCSPIYFAVAITVSAAQVTSVIVSYGLVGATPTTQSLVKEQVPSGSTLPRDANQYYGKLTLGIGTYQINILANWSGSTTPATILSIIGYFGITEPVDMRWWWGASIFIIGLALAGGGFLMIVPRKRGGP
jgi:hypothetical protein